MTAGQWRQGGAPGQGLEVTIEGTPGRVNLSVYVDTLTQLRLALTELDRRLRPPGAGSAKWGIRHLDYENGLRDLITPAQLPRRRDPADLQIPPRALVQGLHELQERPRLPDAFTPSLIERLQHVAEKVGESGVDAVTLAVVNGHRGQPAPITPMLLQNAGTAIKEVTRSYGSVEGVIDLLSARRGRRASVYDARTKRAVTIYYDEALAPVVQSHFEHRVVAEGEVSRNEVGQPVSLRLVKLDDLPEGAVARVQELLGIAPSWLGETSVQEYLDVARSRA